MKKLFNIYLIAIVIFTTLIYSNSIKNGFVGNWYEDQYTMNHDFERDLSWKGLTKLFTETEVVNYHPVTSIFNAILYKNLVMYKAGAHIVNLLMHLITILLLYRLLVNLKVSKEGSLLAVFIFAVHPANVEAVSWVAELKFGLMALLYLISCLAYIRYVNVNKKIYLYSTYFLFIVGLFTHPSFVFFPLILFLIDYYLGRKLSKSIVYEKLVSMVLSIVFAYVVLSIQIITNDYSVLFSGIDRFFIACYAILFYIYKLLLPIKLIAIYGNPVLTDGLLPYKYYLSPVLLILYSTVIYKLKNYRKELIFGSLFFVISILYFTHLFPVEGALLAERHVYFASFGMFFIVAHLSGKIINNEIYISSKWKKVGFGIFSIYMLFFSISTWNRNKVWKDDIFLFNDVISKNPNLPGAYWSRANAKSSMGDPNGAIEDYTAAINLESNRFKIYFNRAVQKSMIEDYNGAISDYTEALKLAPGEHDIFYNRGNLKLILENDSGAIEDFTEALYLSPEFAESYYFRGVAKYNLADDLGSISDYNEAIRIKPDYSDAYYNRGNSKYNLRDYKGAIDDYTSAIKFKPNHAEAYFNRAIQYIIFKDTLAAINDYSSAIMVNPQYANAYGARGLLNLKRNKKAACDDFYKARELGLGAANEMITKNCQ